MIQLREHVIWEYMGFELLLFFMQLCLPKDLIRYIYDYFCLLECQEEHMAINGALVARRHFVTKLKYRVHTCLLCGEKQYVEGNAYWKINRTHRISLSPTEISKYLGWLDDIVFKYCKYDSYRLSPIVIEKQKLSQVLTIYGRELEDSCFEDPLIPYFNESKSTIFEQGIKRKRSFIDEPFYKRMRI